MMRLRYGPAIHRLYLLVLVIALFTGFGNMPIYKRYYIAAIPGLGWSGHFFVNLSVHLISGAVLLALAVASAVVYAKKGPGMGRLTLAGALRAGAFGGVMASGILLAVRNLGGVNFPFVFQMAVTFLHLGMAVALLAVSIGCVVFKRPWTQVR
jgi:hypothetical protein